MLICVKIPDFINGQPVTEINTYAFAQDTSIRHLELPQYLRVIHKHAFEFCTELESVQQKKIGLYPIQIHRDAFYSCYKLSSFTAGVQVVFLGGHQFARCYKLNKFAALNIPQLPAYCFAECESLSRFNFMSDTEIEYNAFVNCKNLKHIMCFGDLQSDTSFFELLKNNNTLIECIKSSNLAELAYEGYKIELLDIDFLF